MSFSDQKKAKWDLFIIFLALYNAFSIPIEVCFKLEEMQGVGFITLNWVIDLCFVLDIVVTFHTSFID